MTEGSQEQEPKNIPIGAPDKTSDERRAPRADARRNAEALLNAAKTVFATSGIEAPSKQIVDMAGVGVGTLYRHFPRRADLVGAVFQREIDAFTDEAPTLLAENPPSIALEKWLNRFIEFVVTKYWLTDALHSGDTASDDLTAHFTSRFGPALENLLKAATVAGEIRATIDARDLLYAAAGLCRPIGASNIEQSRRMVKLVIDGLHVEATESPG
jgi:AcrR family transcriptional regulator